MRGDKKTVLVDKCRCSVPDAWLLPARGRPSLERWAAGMIGEPIRGSVRPSIASLFPDYSGVPATWSEPTLGERIFGRGGWLAVHGEINRCAKSSAPVDSTTESR